MFDGFALFACFDFLIFFLQHGYFKWSVSLKNIMFNLVMFFYVERFGVHILADGYNARKTWYVSAIQ